MKCIVKVGPDRKLEPAYESDQEDFEKLKRGGWYKCTLTQARNPDHHRKGMRLIRDVFENQDAYETMEDLLIEFKLKCGWYTEHITTKGVLMYIPKSLDFASMEQTDFEKFYDRAIDVAIKHFGYKEAAEYAGYN